MKIQNLTLLSPLYFSPAKEEPFGIPEKACENAFDNAAEGFHGEKLYCFELEKERSLSFEPERTGFLGKLLFCGVSGPSEGEAGPAGEETGQDGKANLELPAGSYIFAQEREFLGREEIISMAIEIQKEGLWQRLKPASRLYLRYLYEDSSPVTQLFRPCD